jgi:hypothetical protein
VPRPFLPIGRRLPHAIPLPDVDTPPAAILGRLRNADNRVHAMRSRHCGQMNGFLRYRYLLAEPSRRAAARS